MRVERFNLSSIAQEIRMVDEKVKASDRKLSTMARMMVVDHMRHERKTLAMAKKESFLDTWRQSRDVEMVEWLEDRMISGAREASLGVQSVTRTKSDLAPTCRVRMKDGIGWKWVKTLVDHPTRFQRKRYIKIQI